MARLESYYCTDCRNEIEEIFQDTEERPEVLSEKCPKCGGFLKKFSYKNNPHRVFIQDGRAH